MKDNAMCDFYSVGMPEDDHSNPELGAAIKAARGALMTLLENGGDPQSDERYLVLEQRVTQIKQRMGVDE